LPATYRYSKSRQTGSRSSLDLKRGDHVQLGMLQLHTTVKLGDDDVNKQILLNITSTLSDKDATQVKFNELLEEYRTQILHVTSGPYDPKCHELFAILYFLSKIIMQVPGDMNNFWNFMANWGLQAINLTLKIV
jgi:hypothetical protein